MIIPPPPRAIISEEFGFKVLNENTNHILVNTNQNFTYELNKIFFNDLELKMPKYKIKGKKNF